MANSRKFNGLSFALVAAALFMPVIAQGQVLFRSELSQTRVRVGERAVLSVVLEGDVNTNTTVDLPDLSPHFRVEDQAGPNVSSSMSIINGKVNRKVSLQYQYYLMAVKAGRFTIPRMTYHQGAQSYYTSPIQVEIYDAQSAADAGPASAKSWAPDSDPYLKLELDKTEAYVGEQIKAGWYLCFQRNLFNLKLGNQPQFAPFKALELEKVNRLAPVEKTLKNMPWNVAFLQSLALYPINSGKATIGSLELRFQSQGGQHDFFGMPIGQMESVASDPVSVTVKPLPEPAPADFTGAVGKFEVKTSVARTEARVNEGIHLIVEITGDGNPDYVLEPKMLMPPEFEIYPPEVKNETEAREGRLFARKKFDYLLVAKKDGDFTLPEVSLRYFDPQAEEYKHAVSRPIAMRIFPGAGNPSDPGAAPAPAELGEDIHYIKPDQKSLPDQSTGVFGKGWFWLIHISGLLLVGLALFYRAFQERLTSDQVFARRLRAFGQSKKRLKKAAALARDGKAQEFSAELKRALLEYFGDRFCVSPWGLVEEEIQEVMRKESVPAELSGEFMELISVLSRAQFAGKTESGDLGNLLERAAKLIEAIEKEKK